MTGVIDKAKGAAGDTVGEFLPVPTMVVGMFQLFQVMLRPAPLVWLPLAS